jgi:hypothetical protein
VIRVAIICVVMVSTVVGVTSLLAYRAAKAVPKFYQRALGCPLDAAESAGDFARCVVDTHNEIACQTTWQVTFTDEQINSWLIAHLDDQFPGLLPSEVRDPRIVIEDGRAHLACRYDGNQLSTVLSLTLQSYLTPEENVFAIQIDAVRAGLLPIPLQKVIQHLTTAARRAGLQLRWSQDKGSAVALVSLPVGQQNVRGDVLLETLELRQGELFVAGSVRSAGEPATVADQSSSGANHQR